MPDAQEGLLDGMVTASQLMHRIVDLNREANNLNSRRIAHVEPAERTKKKLNGCTLGCTTSILLSSSGRSSSLALTSTRWSSRFYCGCF